MTRRLSGHFSIIGLVFFVLNSSLGIARQKSCKEFSFLSVNPRSHVRILIYRTWAIEFENIRLFNEKDAVLLSRFTSFV